MMLMWAVVGILLAITGALLGWYCYGEIVVMNRREFRLYFLTFGAIAFVGASAAIAVMLTNAVMIEASVG